ncbi:hypothetical protein LINPERPRIM_LOCUS24828 [Linum perenne]
MHLRSWNSGTGLERIGALQSSMFTGKQIMRLITWQVRATTFLVEVILLVS